MTEYALRDYQKVARDYLRNRGCAALWLDMGLGKTASVLAALEPRHLPVLVLAPKKVAQTVWPPETALWRPDLRCEAAQGEPAARIAVLNGDADIVALGRETIYDLDEIVRSRRYKTIVIDESSGYKDKTTVRWKTTNRFIQQRSVSFVWELTGTPSPNGLLDVWPQIYLLDNGKRLGKYITHYQRDYFRAKDRLPNGVVTKWEIRDGAEEKIHSLLEDICLSMTTDGRVELPELTINYVPVEMDRKSVRIYDEIKEEMVVDLQYLGGVVHTAGNMAALTSKLAQIAAGFIFEDPVYEEIDPTDPYTEYRLVNKGAFTHLNLDKVNALKGIVEEANGSPVMVLYQFVPEKEDILKHVPGAVHVNEPDAINRWNRGEIPVLVAHPQSVGHGLNLQHGGHIQVWTTLTWALEDWEQTIKRLHRSGQLHPVIVHVLMSQVDGSVDYLKRASLDGKAITQDALIEHLESPV